MQAIAASASKPDSRRWVTENMETEYKLSVTSGLSAHFKQPDGPSVPGVDWIVSVSGPDVNTNVLVRTLFSSGPPDQSEQESMAELALAQVRSKLAGGWKPADGESIEVEREMTQPKNEPYSKMRAFWKRLF
jgi:hypothetical protein